MPHVSHTAEGWQVAATGDVYASLREALDAALAGVAEREKPSYFRDEEGAEIGVYRWLPAVAEEDTPLGGVRIDATTIDEMAMSLNGSVRAIPIDGGSDDSPAHGTMVDPGTRANGRGHWLVTVANESGRAEGYLWAELLPDVAREVDLGRLGEGSVHIRFGRKDGDAARDVEYASHALLNDPGVVTLAPANSVRDANSVRRSVAMAGRSMPSGRRSLARAAADAGWTPTAGDRVRVREGAAHDEMTKGAEGEIAEVSPEPAIAIRFDGMDGLHRWYVASELERVEETTAQRARGRGTETMKKITLRAKLIESVAKALPKNEAARGPALDKLAEIARALGVDLDAELAAESWDSPTVSAISALKQLASAEKVLEALPPSGGAEPAEGAHAAAVRSAVTEALGLADDADEAAIVEAIAALKAKAEKPEGEGGEGAASADAEAARAAVAGLRSELVALRTKVAEQDAELAPLRAERARAKLEADIDEALRAKCVSPARRAEVLEHASKHGLESARSLIAMLALPPAGSAVPDKVARAAQAPEAQVAGGAPNEAERKRLIAEAESAVRAEKPGLAAHRVYREAFARVREARPDLFNHAPTGA